MLIGWTTAFGLKGVDGRGEIPFEALTPYGCNSGKLGTKLDSHSTSRRTQLQGWASSVGSALERLGRCDAIEGDVTEGLAWHNY